MSEKKNRMTRQRQIILEELHGLKSHPTADEVHEVARRRMPRISLGTVYRNLEILCDNGNILRLDMCGSRMRFDGNASCHYHARCTKCGRVDDAPIPPIVEIAGAMQFIESYRILDYRLEFLGICSRCIEYVSEIQ